MVAEACVAEEAVVCSVLIVVPAGVD